MLSTRYYCPILMKFEFSRQFFLNTQISNFMKICPVEAELSLADKHDEATSGFRNFVNAPNKTVTQYTAYRGVLYF